ncbi:hypothetical protein K8R42_02075 [bacterium]|nr:hypothetical protein [bacterium]
MSLVEYTDIKIEENNEPLVDLSIFNFHLEPKYFQEGLSNESKIFIRRGLALKLEQIQKKLVNYRFKVWDGYRSRQEQNNIYQKYYNKLLKKHPDWSQKKIRLETGKFVSPPFDKKRIPLHTSGGSIDLTLVNKDGQELNMGTEFDFFGLEAAPLFYEKKDSNSKIAKNRKLLRQAMLTEGFSMDKDEWWHFDFGNQIWALNKNKPVAFYGEANNKNI